MPAPAVYALAVVGTFGAIYAFHQFVYEPHLAPRIEQFAEEWIARRRARRMQQQGPIGVPASIPLRRRRGSHSRHSDSTLSDSDSDSSPNPLQGSPSHRRNGSRGLSRSQMKSHGADFDESFAREVSEWRNEVERNQTSGGLRHRTNIGVHVMDESINPIPHPTMSPTHVIFDTSAPTTPTTTSFSRLSSPPIQVSPLQAADIESTLHASPTRPSAPLKPSPLSQVRTPLPPLPTRAPSHSASPNPSPISPSATTPVPDRSPPSFPSPIPSLSQSYPQELDRERGVELLSPPSSGTSSPFTTFSPLVAPQALSPFAVVQPLDRNPSPETHSWTPNPDSRSLSPHAITDATASVYRSLPASPTSPRSETFSPVNIVREPIRTPSPQEDPFSHPSLPVSGNFTSPNALSPRSPHSDLSDLDFESDLDVISDPGSEGSNRSWAGVSSNSGSSNGRH
ncbi:hypothetical protein AN958_06436 [Leucoagaricus sp. SymC.cos]|nr:hypothetical protein AN958_06436 [Leucoagaricus sp. SymC.cos]